MITGSVLVTGANGFIASRLIPRLLRRGHRVRVLVRRSESLTGRAWLPNVDVRPGSTADADSLAVALQGVHTAYYLIHSMISGRGYAEVERQSAQRFAAASEAAGVQHIIYLGGLADPKDPHLAPHMRSRIETGEMLRQGRVPVSEFRAGVIAGAGSISFEMVRFLAECFPILPGPRWLHNRAQPIASENVIDYLLEGLEKKEGRGGIYEMGGPEQMMFGEVMLRYARCRGLRRHLFTIPCIPIWWMARVVDRLTPVPHPIATALIGGLQSDSRVLDETARLVFPEIQLLTFEQAVQVALGELTPERLERVWEGMGGEVANFRHEGFIIDYRTREVSAPASVIYKYLSGMGSPRQWPGANWMWRLRVWVDGLLPTPAAQGGTGATSNGSYPAAEPAAQLPGLQVGTRLGCYQVEAVEPGRLLRLRSLLKAPGEGWLEWRVDPITETTTRLNQTAFFAPRGLAGFVYWLGLGPFHQIALSRLGEAIRKRVESA